MSANTAEKKTTKMKTQNNNHKKRHHGKKRSGGRFDNNGNRSKSKKVRANVMQNYERNLAKAKEVLAMGNHVEAQDFFQAAEHYLRVILENGGSLKSRGDKDESKSQSKSGNKDAAESGSGSDTADAETSETATEEESSESGPVAQAPRTNNAEARIIVSRSPHEKGAKTTEETLQAV